MEKCTTCGSLEELSSRLDCTLIFLAKSKYSAMVYNLDMCCNDRLMRDLLRYKRILINRLYEYTYPCSDIKVDDIITQVALRVVDTPCNLCPDCPIETLPPTSTTTTTTTTTTSTTTTSTTTISPSNCSRYRIAYTGEEDIPIHYAFSYIACGQTVRTIDYIISENGLGYYVDLCCIPNSIIIDPIFSVTLLNPICIP